MEAKDEDTKELEMVVEHYEEHYHNLDVCNTELVDEIGALKQDVRMANASKAEQARIYTSMIALLEKDRDHKHKIVDEALIAVTTNDRDAIVKLQAGMEDTGKKMQKEFQVLHQDALEEEQGQQQWESENRPSSTCKGIEGALAFDAQMRGQDIHPTQGWMEKSSQLCKPCYWNAKCNALAEAWIDSA